MRKFNICYLCIALTTDTLYRRRQDFVIYCGRKIDNDDYILYCVSYLMYIFITTSRRLSNCSLETHDRSKISGTFQLIA